MATERMLFLFNTPLYDFRIDNALDILLKVQCYLDKKPGLKVIQLGQSYVAQFSPFVITFSGPNVNCDMRRGLLLSELYYL